MSMEPPQGFKPLFRTSPALELIGPLHGRGEQPARVGLRVERSTAMRAARCMVGSSRRSPTWRLAARWRSPPNRRPRRCRQPVARFCGQRGIGDWLQTQVDIQRQGSRLAFANCFIIKDGERIVRASAVFLVTGRLAGAEGG
jgi:hypothetical protein